ncbi:MAG: GNAT family N-acetyltransferase [Flavobacteriales bacterium]|nr:GNAT family N-acetyltransferase [Flavobacteriales bacterium]
MPSDWTSFNPHSFLLEDDRVLLRTLKPEDLEHLIPFAVKEPEIWTYSLQNAGSEASMKKYIERALEDMKNERSIPLIVYDKKLESYAGSTRYYDIQVHHRALSIGYTWYGRDYQGTGLNKHCKYLMLKNAFEEWDYERVEFRADAKNARSIAAMKSIGCTVEGILRNNCTSPTGRRDSIVLSILKDEWYARVKGLLQSKL